MYWHAFPSPFQEFNNIVLIGNEAGIHALRLLKTKEKFTPLAAWQANPAFFAEAQRQLMAYARGELTQFTVRLNPQGTAFQTQVWQALQTIPYGATRTYQQMAEQIGRPKSYRPVGNANNKNPIPILIPCHRVIGKNRQLTGYAYGLEFKQQLIQLEKNQPARAG